MAYQIATIGDVAPGAAEASVIVVTPTLKAFALGLVGGLVLAIVASRYVQMKPRSK